MIKELKIRLILHNMLILTLVFSLLLTMFSIFVYVTEEIEITEELEESLSAARNNPLHLPTMQQKPDDKVYKTALTVFVNGSGSVVVTTPTETNEETIKKAVSFALDYEQRRGNISSLNLSFLKTEVKDGTLISFLSREHLKSRVVENFTHALIAGAVSFFVFLYISKQLADIAVAPVERAWNQQKQFLADASHDLKTPLTVILANNNIISSHKDETVESQMKWIESTSEEASRMSELVNSMLELAKGEAAKEELKIGEADLSELVENSILQFEVVAFEKNITIDSGIQPNIIVRTHAPTFSKVLEILFDNAIKYSDENGKITVTLYQSAKKVYFTINNKGEYIKPDELPHVFERFYRTNKERKVGGHGLGLSIAKKKCDMIGAKISVDSSEADGTTFTITLKARK